MVFTGRTCSLVGNAVPQLIDHVHRKVLPIVQITAIAQIPE